VIRSALAVVAALLGLALPAPSARAHGAEGLAYQGVSGPYLISVFDGRALEGSDLVEYRLVLTQDPKDGQLGEQAPAAPVARAQVVITDAKGANTTAEGIGNVYSFALADMAQTVKVAVDAAHGRTVLAVAVHGVEGSGGGTADRRDWLVPAVVAGGLLLVVGVLRRRAVRS
jgi:hypothetical protein